MRPIRLMFMLTIAALVIHGLEHPGLAQPVKPALRPIKIGRPDLIVSSLTAHMVNPNQVKYSWTITNVGTFAANLDGPTSSEPDNVSVQAMISKDTVFGNADDLPAGGTIIGLSPLGNLVPGASRSGTFTSNVTGTPTTHPFLILKADVGNSVAESNENNNLAVVGITH